MSIYNELKEHLKEKLGNSGGELLEDLLELHKEKIIKELNNEYDKTKH